MQRTGSEQQERQPAAGTMLPFAPDRSVRANSRDTESTDHCKGTKAVTP